MHLKTAVHDKAKTKKNQQQPEVPPVQVAS